VAEAWETKGGVRPPASWQAVMRVNTETAPKDTMRRPTLLGLGEGWYGPDAAYGRQVLSASPGCRVTACQQGAMRNTGSPSAVANRHSHRACKAFGCRRVAEGLVVPTKPGNSGRGKEPWFQDADEAVREGSD